VFGKRPLRGAEKQRRGGAVVERRIWKKDLKNKKHTLLGFSTKRQKNVG
jgi:hypothetical protein